MFTKSEAMPIDNPATIIQSTDVMDLSTLMMNDSLDIDILAFILRIPDIYRHTHTKVNDIPAMLTLFQTILRAVHDKEDDSLTTQLTSQIQALANDVFSIISKKNSNNHVLWFFEPAELFLKSLEYPADKINAVTYIIDFFRNQTKEHNRENRHYENLDRLNALIFHQLGGIPHDKFSNEWDGLKSTLHQLMLALHYYEDRNLFFSLISSMPQHITEYAYDELSRNRFPDMDENKEKITKIDTNNQKRELSYLTEKFLLLLRKTEDITPEKVDLFLSNHTQKNNLISAQFNNAPTSPIIELAQQNKWNIVLWLIRHHSAHEHKLTDALIKKKETSSPLLFSNKKHQYDQYLLTLSSLISMSGQQTSDSQELSTITTCFFSTFFQDSALTESEREAYARVRDHLFRTQRFDLLSTDDSLVRYIIMDGENNRLDDIAQLLIARRKRLSDASDAGCILYEYMCERSIASDKALIQRISMIDGAKNAVLCYAKGEELQTLPKAITDFLSMQRNPLSQLFTPNAPTKSLRDFQKKDGEIPIAKAEYASAAPLTAVIIGSDSSPSAPPLPEETVGSDSSPSAPPLPEETDRRFKY